MQFVQLRIYPPQVFPEHTIVQCVSHPRLIHVYFGILAVPTPTAVFVDVPLVNFAPVFLIEPPCPTQPDSHLNEERQLGSHVLRRLLGRRRPDPRVIEKQLVRVGRQLTLPRALDVPLGAAFHPLVHFSSRSFVVVDKRVQWVGVRGQSLLPHVLWRQFLNDIFLDFLGRVLRLLGRACSNLLHDSGGDWAAGRELRPGSSGLPFYMVRQQFASRRQNRR